MPKKKTVVVADIAYTWLCPHCDVRQFDTDTDRRRECISKTYFVRKPTDKHLIFRKIIQARIKQFSKMLKAKNTRNLELHRLENLPAVIKELQYLDKFYAAQ
ncbi:MAG: hypothetical protein Q7R33_04790 [Nitrosarchaeum sp.]|nr:hypothetical protein [Nitrosarchaeum sp.]